MPRSTLAVRVLSLAVAALPALAESGEQPSAPESEGPSDPFRLDTWTIDSAQLLLVPLRARTVILLETKGGCCSTRRSGRRTRSCDPADQVAGSRGRDALDVRRLWWRHSPDLHCRYPVRRRG